MVLDIVYYGIRCVYHSVLPILTKSTAILALLLVITEICEIVVVSSKVVVPHEEPKIQTESNNSGKVQAKPIRKYSGKTDSTDDSVILDLNGDEPTQKANVIEDKIKKDKSSKEIDSIAMIAKLKEN